MQKSFISKTRQNNIYHGNIWVPGFVDVDCRIVQIEFPPYMLGTECQLRDGWSSFSTRLVTFVEFARKKPQAISWFTTKILPSQEVWYTLVSNLNDVEEFVTWRVRCSIQKTCIWFQAWENTPLERAIFSIFCRCLTSCFFPNGAVASARWRHETTKQTCWNRDGSE